MGRVHPESNVHPTASIHDTATIMKGASVGPNSSVGAMSVVNSAAELSWDVHVLERVTVGAGVVVGHATLFMHGAKICPDYVNRHSSDARKVSPMSTIGLGVDLHNEVELGPGAIVPSQRTIMHIGHFGSKNRVVTIYGSELGPRFSIGCQVGVDLDTIRDRVANNSVSSPSSAGTYTPYLPMFDAVGRQVQDAYNQERDTIEYLMEYRQKLGLPIPAEVQ